MMDHKIYALSFIFYSVTAETTDYCDIVCAKDMFNFTHTMCEYDCHPCYGGRIKFLEVEEKREILFYHNSLRSEVASGRLKSGNAGPQPGASNMLKMEWDPELSRIAQRWAAKCKTINDECRITLDHPTVGQAVGKGGLFMNILNDWYEQSKYFTLRSVFMYQQDEPIEYFTQMVWAGTSYVGCGRTVLRGGNREILVCNYAPAGNIEGGEVYRIGVPCSECPNGTKCSEEYPKLCSYNEPMYDHRIFEDSSPCGNSVVISTYSYMVQTVISLILVL